MKITALVENQSNCDLKPTHGLSLYIETKKHKLLFDLGPDRILFENARKKGIRLEEVDTAVISHGHMDHGGALGPPAGFFRSCQVLPSLTAPSQLKPLDKRRFIRTVVTRVPVKIQCTLLFGTGQQHHFVTVRRPGNFFRIMEAFCRIKCPRW